MSDATTSTVCSLSALLKAAVANHMFNVFGGWLPGRIHSISGKRKASIEILIQEVEETRLGRTVKPFPLINEVPIIMLGRGGAYIEWAPQVGDTVIVLFCNRSTDRYHQTGGLVDPDDVRMHDFDDAIALPVADFDFAHVSSANPQIKFTGSTIEAGGVAPLALNADLSTVIAKVNALIAVHNTHGHPVVGGTASPTVDGQLPGVLSPVTGTQKLKGG